MYQPSDSSNLITFRTFMMYYLARSFKHRFQPLQQPKPRCFVRECQLLVAKNTPLLQPAQELGRWPQAEDLAHGRGIVITRGLVIEHHVIATGNTHEIIASGRR